MRSPEIVVIGGGAVGLGIAWRLAQRGLPVQVLDSDQNVAASVVAAGMLAPVTEVHYGEEALLALNIASSELYPTWVAELEEATGVGVGYERCGTLMVARDADDNEGLDHVFRFQEELGLKVERLRGRECRALEPSLVRGARGGILVEGDHRIDPVALVAALQVACERAGVVRSSARVVSLHIGDGGLGGVLLADGALVPCTGVVIAAGCWSAALLPPGALPVRPVKGQLLRLRAGGGAPAPHRNIRGLDAYIVPRADGRVIVGATVEEAGFDTSARAGAVQQLLDDAYELIPAVAEYGFEGVAVGLRPAAPDNAPLLGATEVPNVYVATGHYRNGILLTPITADRVAELVATGAAPADIAPFDPRRFATSRAESLP